jgi:hypothetical protein
VHVHFTHRQRRQAGGGRQRLHGGKARGIIRPAQQRAAHPGATRKAAGQPAGGFERRLLVRQQHRQHARAQALNILPGQPITTLVSRPPAAADQLAQIAVAVAVGGQQHQPRAVVQAQLGADDERQAVLPGRPVRAHHAAQAAFVGDGERRVAERGGARHQLLGMGGAAHVGMIGNTGQFRVGR